MRLRNSDFGMRIFKTRTDESAFRNPHSAIKI